MENMQDMSQLKSSLSLSNTDQVKQDNSIKFERESAEYNDETGGIYITFFYLVFLFNFFALILLVIDN